MNKIFLTITMVLFFGLVQAQNVGIGTTTPTYPLTIHTDGIGLSQENNTAVNKVGFYTSAAACFLQTHTNTDLSFATNNGNAQLTLQKATGFFGIGTSAPNQKLEIRQGRLRFNGDPAANTSQGIEFTDGNGSSLNGFMGTYNDSMMGLYGFQGAGWRFLFNNKTGNVGLQGNSNPQVALSFAATIGKKISLYRGTTGDVGMGVYGNEFRLHTDYNGADITFGYDNFTNGFTENMRIKANGNVGIGTNTPAAKLDISSATGADGLSVGTSSQKVVIRAGGLFGSVMGSTSGSGAFSLMGNGNTAMTITTAGKVGIGTLLPEYMLDVNGRMRLQYTSGNTAGLWLNNSSNDEAGFIGQYDDNTTGMYGSSSGWGFLYGENDGIVRIGTTQKASGYLLNVGGKIIAEEVRVQLRSAWPDYVFAKNYRLTPLQDLETYIQANNHLPNVPAAAEVETSGIALGEMQKKMMEKIEELTLYVIALEKKIQALEKK